MVWLAIVFEQTIEESSIVGTEMEKLPGRCSGPTTTSSSVLSKKVQVLRAGSRTAQSFAVLTEFPNSTTESNS